MVAALLELQNHLSFYSRCFSTAEAKAAGRPFVLAGATRLAMGPAPRGPRSVSHESRTGRGHAEGGSKHASAGTDRGCAQARVVETHGTERAMRRRAFQHVHLPAQEPDPLVGARGGIGVF